MSPLLGIFGSVLWEVARGLFVYQTTGLVPEKYDEPLFWASRLVIALCAASFVYLFQVQEPLLAAGLGLATPGALFVLGMTVQTVNRGFAARPDVEHDRGRPR